MNTLTVSILLCTAVTILSTSLAEEGNLNREKRQGRAVAADAEEGSGTEPASQNTCTLAPDVGPCIGNEPQFFYNSSSMVCEPFTYGGCMGNANRFKSIEECHKTCRTDAVCSLPVLVGKCKAIKPAWAFDMHKNACTMFTYSGCQGNGNRFSSKIECEMLCQRQQHVLSDIEEGFLDVNKKQD
uniref:BPTI/Kunitz inhibitor domain-containing protein n=1 Tax=Eptatretus burgeri TaxID=7764 RepID=A0A8C4N2Z7_EPTBU